MKKLFEEYGKIVVIALIIVALLVLVPQIGASIKENILTTSVIEPDILLSSGSDTINVSKGDLITIDSKEYRVLSVEGTQAKLLAIYSQGGCRFNNSSVTTSFNGTMGEKYESSILDNYLENEFYPSLSFKDAIISQNITQNMYKYNGTPADASSWFKDGFTSTDTSGTNYTLSKIGSVSVGERHVYALDIEDIINYLGSSWTPQQLNELFLNVDYAIENIFGDVAGATYISLRSATEYSYNTFCVCGNDGVIQSVKMANSGMVVVQLANPSIHPAFVIDLSKVEYTK